ncbi:cyclin-D1-binding protein 1 isoform X2 [Python bivittatus]|uniref:Cyclin-D1-binding protein 1 isoform X2 n=1 Tax=Python bivittatus TaxID=176946 RepID=A0A9F5N697_PYTBI|nr:cyclin-D1-binding protein 1 isoform X2 [Python bivittatus]
MREAERKGAQCCHRSCLSILSAPKEPREDPEQRCPLRHNPGGGGDDSGRRGYPSDSPGKMQAEGGSSPGDLLEVEELGFPGNRDLSWSDAEWQLLGPCKGLVKATKAGLRKVLGAVRTHGKADTNEQVGQLDALADAVAELSPSVDELVLSLCPPVNQLTLRLNAGKLASVLMKMLEITRTSHICPPSEENWVQFLAGAVDHNMGKIRAFTQDLLGDPGPAGEDWHGGAGLGGAWAKEQP